MQLLLKLVFSILLISKLISCTTPTIDKKKQIVKEFDEGEKYVKEVINLFDAGRLNEVATTFSEICKKNNLTPVMKLRGFSVVYNSFIRKETHDSALQYLDSCINIIEGKKLETILPGQYIGYLLYKSASLYRLHRPNEANVIFYKVKKMNDVNEDVSNRSVIAEQLAFISYRQKNYKEALESFKEVLSLHSKILADNFYAELAGNGLLISANYERQILKKTRLNVRVGIGTYGTDKYTTYPFGINYLLKLKNSNTYIDFGLGGTYTEADVLLYMNVKREPGYKNTTSFCFIPSVGIRHQTTKNFMFRFALTPVFNHNGSIPYIGISVGKSF